MLHLLCNWRYPRYHIHNLHLSFCLSAVELFQHEQGIFFVIREVSCTITVYTRKEHACGHCDAAFRAPSLDGCRSDIAHCRPTGPLSRGSKTMGSFSQIDSHY